MQPYGSILNGLPVLTALIVVLLNSQVTGLSANIYDVPHGTGSTYGAGDIVQYVRYTDTVVFNKARAVCQAIGGELAKIETAAKRTWIKTFAGSAFNNPLWTGLVEPSSGNTYWLSDCSTDNVPSLTIGGEWASDKKCIHLKSGEFTFDMKSCNGDYEMFMCELRIAITSSDTNVSPSYSSSADPSAVCTQPATTTTSTSTTTTTTPTTTTTSTSTYTTSTSPTTSTSTTSTSISTTTTKPKTTTTTPATTSKTTSTSILPTTTLTTPQHLTSPTATSTSTASPTSTQSSATTTSTSSISTSTTNSSTVCADTSVALCVCFPTSANISIHAVIKLAEELSRNLTINTKETSSYRRTLTCAEDNRPSSKYIGFSGIVFVVVSFSLIVLPDALNVLLYLKLFFNPHGGNA